MKKIAIVFMILYLSINGLITIGDLILVVMVLGVIVLPFVVGLDLLELIYIMLEEMRLIPLVKSLLFHVELIEITLTDDCAIVVIDKQFILMVIDGSAIIVLIQELLRVLLHLMILWVEVNGSLEVRLVLVDIVNDHFIVGVSFVICLD
jgi:hypothetical protein